MVDEQNTGKPHAAVDGCVSSKTASPQTRAQRSHHHPAHAVLTDCAARTLARRLLPGLEQARAIIDVAILTMRYYNDSPPEPSESSRRRNLERAKHLLAAFDDGRHEAGQVS